MTVVKAVKAGFSLVEVVVAVVVLEVGLLGTTGLLLSAAHALSRAEVRSYALGEIRSTLDSLEEASGLTSGRRRTASGSVEWSVSPAGTVEVRFRVPGEGVIASLTVVRIRE